MDVSLFDFDLPESCIALRPVSPRDSAKMLLVDDGVISDSVVRDLPDQLRAGDVLVINDTRVLPAAMTAIRPARAHGGGGDVTLTINLHKALSDQEWRAFIRPAKRLKDGDILHFSEQLTAEIFDKQEGGDVGLHFNLSGQALQGAINMLGAPPLPPYIARKRAPDAADIEDYQTVYAKDDGSVAAPTAGLHFTPDLMQALRGKGVIFVSLTLHVGAGTFLPMKTDNTQDHIMHSEWREISPEAAAAINKAKASGGRVIAVGTTALRAMESAVDSNGQLKAEIGETDIFITPGYDFKIIDGLMTNFHLPKSTLFMLVSAVSGLDVMKRAYDHAIKTGYRFYSYGDSSLLWVAKKSTS